MAHLCSSAPPIEFLQPPVVQSQVTPPQLRSLRRLRSGEGGPTPVQRFGSSTGPNVSVEVDMRFASSPLLRVGVRGVLWCQKDCEHAMQSADIENRKLYSSNTQTLHVWYHSWSVWENLARLRVSQITGGLHLST